MRGNGKRPKQRNAHSHAVRLDVGGQWQLAKTEEKVELLRAASKDKEKFLEVLRVFGKLPDDYIQNEKEIPKVDDVIRDIIRENRPKAVNQAGRHYNHNRKYKLLPGIGYRVDTRPMTRQSIIDDNKINKIMRENYENKEWVVSEGDNYLYTHSVEHRKDMWKAAELQYKEEQAVLAKEKLEKVKSRKRKRKQMSDSSSSESEYEGDTDISSSETSGCPINNWLYIPNFTLL